MEKIILFIIKLFTSLFLTLPSMLSKTENKISSQNLVKNENENDFVEFSFGYISYYKLQLH